MNEIIKTIEHLKTFPDKTTQIIISVHVLLVICEEIYRLDRIKVNSKYFESN